MFSNSDNQGNNNEMVQVVVRCRPMSEKETECSYTCVVRMDTSRSTVEIVHPKPENACYPKMFKFDATFDGEASQCDIYDQMVQPLIDAVLCGYNGTVFAYGQSGSGKTYTMEGLASESEKGILPRSFHRIFDHISKSSNIQYLIRTSYIEIYQDEIRDLLSRDTGKKFEVRESKDCGVFVKGISSFVCKNEKEMNMIIEAGRRNRKVAATNINERSSRSHAIVTITVEMRDLTGPSEGRVRVGKLNLVDLAGSERQKKTNAEGDRLKEANKINLSLSALGNVISALSENRNHHIPYRDSKLTRILKDSLGGNSKTLMIANIGPASSNYDESLNTLRYASRAKNIRNIPQINEDPVDTLIRRYQEEIKRLKCQLLEQTVLKKCSMKNNALQEFPVATADDRGSKSTFNEESIPGTDNDSSSEERDTVKNVYDVEKEKQDADVKELKRRIALMESRLLIGHEDILEHTSEQKKVLEEHKHEIVKIKQREVEISQFLEKEKEMTEELKEDYYNLKQEIEVKSKKLSKSCQKLQDIQQQIIDAKEEFNADRRELEMTQHEILKEIKLKLLIMKNFIPKEQRRKILPRMYYNEDMDCWQLKPISEQIPPLNRPTSDEYMRSTVKLHSTPIQSIRYGKLKKHNQSKYKFNVGNGPILELDLIRSPRITKDFNPPKLPPALKTIFQAALQLEEDIDIDATSPTLIKCSYMDASRRSFESISQTKHETNPRRTKSAANLPVYPKARGLVPK